MNDGVVAASGLRFSYQTHEVLTDASFQLARGEIFGVVGADGAGKTTLMRLVIGQLAPDRGRLTVLGMPAQDTRLRSRVAYMPQTFGQYLDLTVGENLQLFADLHGLARAQVRRVMSDLLERTGLAPFVQRRAGQLSGGMMQKLALACALVSHPELMVLDEPTTGVDPVSRRAFWQLLEQVRAEGVAIVYATSNLDEAERCDRVGMLSEGRFTRSGPPLELITQVHAQLVELSGPDARAKRTVVRAMASVDLVFPVGRTLRVWLRDAAVTSTFADELRVAALALSMQALRPSLHDVAMRELALSRTRSRDHAAAERH
ncbi:MAG TPA: ABC transporter ATP-binding protein [Casimicrobiaceae bacterium]|nr:ABC transporter ATP-binding protein [Casimicrobiaceae bacterium]